ncbi:MAG: sugar transferase, partial [Mycobacterium sp.]|nr:sugar transferase [Mycobacterium sp.]
MALVVVDYLHPLGQRIFPARAIPVYAVPLIIVFVSVCRLFARALVRYVQRRGYALRDVVIVGSGPLAERVRTVLTKPANGYRIAGVVAAEHDGDPLWGDVPVFTSLEAALDKLGGSVEEVVQVDPDIDRTAIERMMSLTTSHGITYRFVPNEYGVYAAASSMTTIAGVPMMNVRLTSLDGWGAVGKRAFDIIGAASLIVLLSPLFLFVAAAVKITDPAGPIFYRNPRIGRGGTTIKILKFRSMMWQYSTGPGRDYATADEALRAMGRPDLADQFIREMKVHNDPRITRIGHFIRRTSLDELPQLFDVLRGRMSLIGPRPVPVEDFVHYSEELVAIGGQRANYLALKPGMTGLWQVSGRSSVSYQERVKLDIYYSANWSMKLDLAILARTPGAVFARRGAY